MKNILKNFLIVFRCSPFLTIILGISYIGSSIIWGISPVMYNYLFIMIEEAIKTNNIIVLEIPVLVFIIYNFFEIFFRILGRLPEKLFQYSEIVNLNLRLQILNKVKKLDVSFFEDKNNNDKLERAYSNVDSGNASQFINLVFQFPSIILSLIIMVCSIIVINYWLIIIAIMSAIPVFIIKFRQSLKSYKVKNNQTQNIRIKNYLWNLFFNNDVITDIKANNRWSFFETKFDEISKLINHNENINNINEFKENTLCEILKVLGYIFGIIVSIILINNKLILLPTFAVILSSFSSLQSTLTQLILNFTQMRKMNLFFEDYNKFLMCDEEMGKDKIDFDFKNISFEKVSYSYPNNMDYVLKDINITIKKGECIALVGVNGSGKSTFCKLISGLILPTEGIIKINNLHNLNDFRQSFYKQISYCFQDFQKYKFRIRENVAFSDIVYLNDDCKIQNSIKLFSENDEIINKLDLLIGKEFNGADLSGGQWQKLALSRVFFKENDDILIFDEPTSSIDPITEFEIIQNLLKNIKQRTSIIVTHRVGSARLADRIIVFDNGEIIGDGTHKELLESCDVYKELYEHQAKWYE